MDRRITGHEWDMLDFSHVQVRPYRGQEQKVGRTSRQEWLLIAFLAVLVVLLITFAGVPMLKHL